MDYRLDKIDGNRLVHLLRSDAPRVAQALVDKMLGRAKVFAGAVGTTRYLEFVNPGVYTVVIRADDWRKIFPIIRYGTGAFTPIVPHAEPPELVPSPQEHRVMLPPPENPGPGIRSFLAYFSWEEYGQIQRLLTISNVGRESTVPLLRRMNQSGMPDVYERLVGMLEQLFPHDFPNA